MSRLPHTSRWYAAARRTLRGGLVETSSTVDALGLQGLRALYDAVIGKPMPREASRRSCASTVWWLPRRLLPWSSVAAPCGHHLHALPTQGGREAQGACHAARGGLEDRSPPRLTHARQSASEDTRPAQKAPRATVEAVERTDRVGRDRARCLRGHVRRDRIERLLRAELSRRGHPRGGRRRE